MYLRIVGRKKDRNNHQQLSRHQVMCARYTLVLALPLELQVVLLGPPVLRYCRNVRPTWVKFDSKDTKESEWCSRFGVLSPRRGLR